MTGCITVLPIPGPSLHVEELCCPEVGVTIVTLIPGPQGPPGQDGEAAVADQFAPVDGQTQFQLSAVPSDPTSVKMWINGQRFRPPTSFTVVADMVTWLSEFMIDSTDEIEIEYR